ncbi:MAG: hypothetical protein KDK45_06135, partial [Leptospiraceae bacterium]|nr:hypothetical protein [Leptospiraceae bacterium]
MLIRIFVLICLLLPGLFLLAFDKAHYTVTDFFQASVDWSDMKVSASVEEKLPRVVINTRDRDFGKEEVAFNISE